MTDRRAEILRRVETAWQPMQEAVGRLGEIRLLRPTSAGWTARELVAHLSFWDEAVLGVVVGMFRREALPDDWRFGSGYLPDDGQGWPSADEHNAREAAWARARTGPEVLARFPRAHDQLVAILSTVTEQEASDHADYFHRLGLHYVEHQPELDGLLLP
jgi:hypothetical protein